MPFVGLESGLGQLSILRRDGIGPPSAGLCDFAPSFPAGYFGCFARGSMVSRSEQVHVSSRWNLRLCESQDVEFG